MGWYSAWLKGVPLRGYSLKISEGYAELSTAMPAAPEWVASHPSFHFASNGSATSSVMLMILGSRTM